MYTQIQVSQLVTPNFISSLTAVTGVYNNYHQVAPNPDWTRTSFSAKSNAGHFTENMPYFMWSEFAEIIILEGGNETKIRDYLSYDKKFKLQSIN